MLWNKRIVNSLRLRSNFEEKTFRWSKRRVLCEDHSKWPKIRGSESFKLKWNWRHSPPQQWKILKINLKNAMQKLKFWKKWWRVQIHKLKRKKLTFNVWPRSWTDWVIEMRVPVVEQLDKKSLAHPQETAANQTKVRSSSETDLGLLLRRMRFSNRPEETHINQDLHRIT